MLVSEFMLQQTPVNRVIPHLEAWLARWPTPAALAAAPPADAVRQWANLGYPRRALWLHRAAVRDHASSHGGVVPRDVDALLALSGIGDYTARAVAVFAYGDRHPVVDTNTRRVLARAVDGRAQPGAAVEARPRRDGGRAPGGRCGRRDRQRRRDGARRPRLHRPRAAVRRMPAGACLRVARRRLSRHGRRPAPPGALRGQRPPGARRGAEAAAGRRGRRHPDRRPARGLARRAPARPGDHLARRRRPGRAGRRLCPAPARAEAHELRRKARSSDDPARILRVSRSFSEVGATPRARGPRRRIPRPGSRVPRRTHGA